MLGTSLRVLLFLFLFQGCGLQSYLAGQVDLLLEMRIHGQLDLYYQQKKSLSQDIDLWLIKQKTYVPEVRQLVMGPTPQDPKQVEEKLLAFTQIYKRSAIEFNQLFCKYLALLDQKQQKHFLEKQTEDIQKIQEQLTKMDLEQLRERVEFFLGPVNSQQLPLLKNYLPHWRERTADRLKRRVAFKEDLQKILATQEINKEELLNQKFKDYVESSIADQSQVVKFIQTLAASLTSEQLKHLMERKVEGLKLLESFNESEF